MARCDPAALFQLHVQTLFVCDGRGRMVSTNEPRPRPAPRVYAGTWAGGRVVLVRHDVEEGAAREWTAAGRGELRDRVARHRPIVGEHRGPAFVLPAMVSHEEVVGVSAGIMLHPELLSRGWLPNETPPYLGVVRDGMVVAVCYSSRTTAQGDAAGVETVTAYRGQGLGATAVRAWVAAVQAAGRYAFYSTEWTNAASLGLARKLGAIEIGEDWSLG